MSVIPKILVVSNLQTTSTLWALNITQQRWNIAVETHPAAAVQRWVELLPDLIVCDIEPESLGVEVVTQLRVEAVLPILLLTLDHSDKFLLEAYQAGVDECILKPIDPMLLDVKLKAWLRRTAHVPVNVLDAITIDDFHLIPSDRVLVLDERAPIHLTNLELRLLYYLMGRPGRTLSTEELCHHVWSQHSIGDPTTLKNLVYRLRRKIEIDPAHPQHLHTVAGVGYRFVAK